MVQLNLALREINCKIVYFGPGLSGKTTNLEVVHEKAPEDSKGDLTSIATESDRTLFFDFMPLNLGTVGGMRTKFQLYTVPGQVYYNSTRKLVLRGADGVIFVADSSPDKMDENIESLENLEDCLREQGKSLADFPHVIQWNKRDIPGALPPEELNRVLNPHGAPTFEAVASEGTGVVETFKGLSGLVLETVKAMADRHSSGRSDARRPGLHARSGAARPVGGRGMEGPPRPAQPAPPAQAPPAAPRAVPTAPETVTPAAVLDPGDPESSGDLGSGTRTPTQPPHERTVAGVPVQESSPPQEAPPATPQSQVGSLTANLAESSSSYVPQRPRGTQSAAPVSGLIRATPIGVDPNMGQSSSSQSSGLPRAQTSATSGRLMVSSSRHARSRGMPGGTLLWIALIAAIAGGIAFAFIGGLL